MTAEVKPRQGGRADAPPSKRRKNVKAKKRRPPAVPVTREDVDQFLASWTALNYLRFTESNVKRRVVRMLIYLREEVERLERDLAAAMPAELSPADANRWTSRVRK